jgi:hypothetical protein
LFVCCFAVFVVTQLVSNHFKCILSMLFVLFEIEQSLFL